MTRSSVAKSPSTERWWAPQRPTLDPDAVVLAMLEPGDLGSALLALHRAGAAAIDTVAKSAMSSERALIDAMVRARAQVADKVVDSVCKSATPSYAGLFVMDVFDDAEAGVLSIYRTAVTKGMNPSVAAKRAGDVFGVPAKLMGTYASVATDPKSNPATVQALADRTLLEHVSHVVAIEAPAEPVSKANEGQYQEAPEPERNWRESEVMRDALGRFAPEPGSEPPPNALESIRRRLGLTGAPSQVAGEPVRQQRQRQTRQVRQTRVVRTTRAVAQPQAEHKTERVLVRAKGERVAAQRQQIAREVNRAARRTIVENEQKSQALVPTTQLQDVLADFPAHKKTSYYELDHEVSIRTDLKTGAALRSQADDQARRLRGSDETVFRIGHLLRIAGSESPPERPGSIHDTTNRHDLSQAVLEAGDGAHPHVEVVNAVDLNMSRRSEKDYVEGERQRVAEEKNNQWTRGVHRVDEDAHTFAFPIYRPYGWPVDDDGPDQQVGNWAIVHIPAADPMRPHDRDLPTVEEFVLLGNPRGSNEGTPRQPNLELDPNDAYKIVYPPGAEKSGPRVEELWDAENGVIVNRWYLKAISEDELDEIRGGVGKAEQGQYAYQPRPTGAWRESEVIRDAFGRFAQEPEKAQEQQESAARTRAVRSQRRVRAPRQARAAAAPVVQREIVRAGVKRRTGQRSTQREQYRETGRELSRYELEDDEAENLGHLSDVKDYKVFTAGQWEKAIELLDLEGADLYEGYETVLDPLTRRALSEQRVHSVYNIYDRLARNVDADQGGSFKVMAHMPVHEALDMGRLGRYVSNLFQRHPEVVKIEMMRVGDTLRFVGNTKTMPVQNLVEVDPEVDWDKPVYLHFVGEFKVDELHRTTNRGEMEAIMKPAGTAKEGDPEGIVANPVVHLYRISTRHWRAAN